MNLKLDLTKIIVLGLLLLFYGSFLVYKIDLPAAQDLPRQMQNGEDVLTGNFKVLTKNVYSYIEPNQPFANHHWLYGVFVFLLHKAINWEGMVIFKAVVLLTMFCFLFWLVAKKYDFWLTAALSIPVIFVLIYRTALRPEIFSYLFAVIFLHFLLDLQENPKHKRIFWLILLQIIWVNTHLFFGTGILMTAGFLFERIITHYKTYNKDLVIKKLILLLAGLIIAIFINPFGLKGALFSFKVNSSKDFPISSAEINTISNILIDHPGISNISAFLFIPMAVLLAISFILTLIFRWKMERNLLSNNIIFWALASLGSGLISFYVIRALPFFGIIFLPAATANLNEIFKEIKYRLEEKLKLFHRKVFLFFIFLLMAVIIKAIFFSQNYLVPKSDQGVGLANWSESSAKFYKENNLKGPVFNDTDIGSYLIYYLYPEEKVFSDNRFGDAYSASFFTDILFPMMQDEQKWEKMSQFYGINVIFFNHYDAGTGVRDFIYRRFYDPKWALVHVDRNTVIFVKRVAKNQSVINKFEINEENLYEKIGHLLNSPNSEDQLAGADIFNLFGRTDLSIPAYLKFVSQWPNRGKVWMVLGRTELLKADQNNSNPYLAAVYLERAIKEKWATWETYSYLALAYYRTGQIERAREAVAKEAKMVPNHEDVKAWHRIFANEAEKRKK